MASIIMIIFVSERLTHSRPACKKKFGAARPGPSQAVGTAVDKMTGEFKLPVFRRILLVGAGEPDSQPAVIPSRIESRSPAVGGRNSALLRSDAPVLNIGGSEWSPKRAPHDSSSSHGGFRVGSS
jgi:hypothetical protein